MEPLYENILNRLTPPTGKVRIVIDTDTFNEIDDQFAVAYALSSPEKLQVEAIYAAPFFNAMSNSPGDGMEKSYNEIQRILRLFGREAGGFAYRGSEHFMTGPGEPVMSDAVRDLIEKAKESKDDDPLYVVSIGAITNVASALLAVPEIKNKIVVVWLGGHALHWPNCHEFNLRQDVHAARIVLDSGVPLVLVPCMGVASHLSTTLAEVERYVKNSGAIGNYLYDTLEQCREDHYAYSRVIWDAAAIAWLIEPKWAPSDIISSPVISLSDMCRWSIDASRHPIRCVNYVKRDPIFADMFRKIDRYSK